MPENNNLSVLETEWQSRLLKFYQKYQPDKVDNIPSLLAKIDNKPARFDKLLDQLVSKYGPEPEDGQIKVDEDEDEESNSEEEGGKDDVSEKSVDESKTDLQQAKKLDLNQQTENMNVLLSARLENFYNHYNKEKMSTVSNLVERTKSNPNYQKRLIKMLVKKYGPEPESSSLEKLSEKLSKMEISNNSDMQANSFIKRDPNNSVLNEVVYCPVDGMPPEYCEFLASFPETLPWLNENYPHLILSTKGNVAVKEFCHKLEQASSNKDGETAADEESQLAGSLKSRGGAAAPNKLLKQKKKEKERLNLEKVKIERITRNKKKFVTILSGVEVLENEKDMKVKDIAKMLGKKFACSASVTKTKEGRPCIDIQGDVGYELKEFLGEEFNLPEDRIQLVE